MIHKPVLLGEVIENLNLKPGMTVVDGTLGAGGHSVAILEKIMPGGKLISVDWDRRAVKNFEKKLGKGISFPKRKLIQARPVAVNSNKNNNQAFFHFIKLGNREGKIIGYWHGAACNYKNITEIVRGLGIDSVDAVFVDLGFSSDQIEDARRGFSFQKNGPLDMRYSPETQKLTAAGIVNGYPEEKLVDIFKRYGEEKFAKRIAREIVKHRKIREIKESGELVKIIIHSMPKKFGQGRVHPATKVFQALRIETNRELENLKIFLKQAPEVLASEGILAIISFHSLEDRIVKKHFREESRDCVCPPIFPKCICDHKARLKIITKKPISASEREIRENPRARSAKLRVAQKI